MIRVAGVDGGGTRTRCLIADASGRVLGQGAAGPANCATLSPPAVAIAIHESLSAACRAAAGTPADLDALCIGLAGFYPPWHAEELTSLVAPLLSSTQHSTPQHLNTPKPDTQHPALLLVPDLVIAWAGGTALRPGVALVGGTGSVAYGRNACGEGARAGGWGYLAGDEGSAYWIGREALRAVARALDGRSGPTALSGLLPRRCPNGYEAAEEWLRGVYRERWSPAQVASLAPAVLEAATGSDAAAAAILTEAGRHLGRLAEHVLRRLELTSEAVPVVAAGGVLDRAGPVRAAAAAWLQRAAPLASLQAARLPPVAGALLLALEQAGVTAGEETLAGLANSLGC